MREIIFTGSSIVGIAEDQVSADVEGETVVLNLKSGMYYGLNEVGTGIWNLIQDPKTVDEIRDSMMEAYEVELDTCERDLVLLLQEMATEGLIAVKNETSE